MLIVIFQNSPRSERVKASIGKLIKIHNAKDKHINEISVELIQTAGG